MIVLELLGAWFAVAVATVLAFNGVKHAVARRARSAS